jgi:filamentous hemagglutinin family protein
MKLTPGSIFQLFIYLFSFFCLTNKIAIAQVTPDGTVNTQVTPNGNVSEITGGEARGGNLFHSFQDFSVPTGNEAAFLNADTISNILSRVTGGNISNIDGLISTSGSANLFLINPAGIIFGENASLDVGGSFYASSASSILFEDGEFSATDLATTPVLTINAPIGLGFRDQPGDIVNRSFALNSALELVGLEVAPGNNLALIGGNINFEAGEATASGGNITLGGLSQAGTVGFNQGNFSFPEEVTKSNITLSNAADVDVSGTGGGNITINAQNLSLAAGEFGGSFLRSGIISDSTSADAQAGNITIDATGAINLSGTSVIFNQVASGGTGDAGNININTNSLSLLDGSQITAGVFGQGNAGRVSINASENITFQGADSDGLPSGVINNVESGSVGNAGNIEITAANLNLIGGGRVTSNAEGQGNAGLVDITATEDLTFDGEDSQGDASGVFSQVSSTGIGNAAGITISTSNLTLTNGGQVDASTLGQGNAGAVNINATGDLTFDGEDSAGFTSGVISLVNPGAVGNAGGITISTANLNLKNGGVVDASTFGKGNAGAVNITATGDLTFDGENSEGFSSGVFSQVNSTGIGNAAGVTISTTNLNLNNGGKVSASTLGQGSAGGVTISTVNLNLTGGGSVSANTLGQGDAGSVDIIATEGIIASGEDPEGFPSGITSLVDTGAVGNAGGITISTSNLTLTNGGRVEASAFGQGNAEAVNITATDSIFISGSIERFRSGISANALIENGNGGDVNITTNQLTIADGGAIEATNFDSLEQDTPGIGLPGNIFIEANNLDLSNNGRIEAATQSATGASGVIDLQVAENITLQSNSFISAQAFNNANGGNLTIDARFIIAYPSNGTGNDFVATADAGMGGNIDLNVEQIFGLQSANAIDRNNNFINNNTNDIDASSNIEGLEGSVNINTSGVNPVQGATELPTNVVELEQTTQQTCQANRETTAKNTLTVRGKGGIPTPPDQPLNSQNVTINGETNPTSVIPEPIETSQGKIQPARGVKITESGEIILTAYRTNNQGERLFEGSINCGI